MSHFPGAIANVIPTGIALLDAEERVWEAMLEGWRRQQSSRALKSDTVYQRVKVMAAFRKFTGEYPWQWQPQAVIDYSDSMRSRGCAVSTVRQHQNAIRLFLDFVTDARYGYPKECEQRFGATLVQICDEWNTIEHTSEYEADPERRPLTVQEVQHLFDYADDRFEEAKNRKRKGTLTSFRDAVMVKTVYAYGLRNREARRITMPDFMLNPQIKQYGKYGGVHIRWGKAVKGSPPRRRHVLTVPHLDWIVDVLQQYTQDVRPQFKAGDHPGLFVTERLGYVSGRSLDIAFKEMVTGAGLDPVETALGI